jgi:hypothetical protein
MTTVHERLRVALHEVTGAMTLQNTKVAIEGSHGLSLRMNVEQDIKRVGQGLGGLWVTLRLEDKKGLVLAGVVSPRYPGGVVQNKEMLANILELLADRMVDGGGEYMPLVLVVNQREASARGRLQELQEAVGQIKAAEQDLESATAASAWVAKLPDRNVEEVGF